MTSTNDSNGAAPTFDIPKECKAGVVVNEGPDFHVEVQTVPVPEIGRPFNLCHWFHSRHYLVDLGISEPHP